jgi:anthranilate phosphoribosyltransferase
MGDAVESFVEDLARLVRGEALSRARARAFLDAVLEGSVEPTLIAGMLVALRIKGEEPEELAGFAEAMVDHMVPIDVAQPVVDTCGTGGDRARTINVSTGAALVAAAAGARVLKHGGRASSSLTGSADVLEALGVPTQLGAEELRAELERTRFGFAFAPRFHPAMAQVAPVRRALGVPTAFNVLGPLVNPARATLRLVGVWEEGFMEPVARVLATLGVRRALVVHGEDGLDEISVSAETRALELLSDAKGGVELVWHRVRPEDLGVARWPQAAVQGGDAAHNAAILEAVLEGRASGAVLDVILANAGAALWIAGLADSPREGVERARSAIEEGAAGATLASLRSRG